VLSPAERERAAQALLGAARDHATIPPISVTWPAAEVEDALVDGLTAAWRQGVAHGASRLRARFAAGLDETIAWYRSNEAWWRRVKSGEYRRFYDLWYGDRLN